jgi:hypothetical protein
MTFLSYDSLLEDIRGAKWDKDLPNDFKLFYEDY